jgi:hypothetical protein
LEEFIPECMGKVHGGIEASTMGNADFLDPYLLQGENSLLYLLISLREKVSSSQHGVYPFSPVIIWACFIELFLRNWRRV